MHLRVVAANSLKSWHFIQQPVLPHRCKPRDDRLRWGLVACWSCRSGLNLLGCGGLVGWLWLLLILSAAGVRTDTGKCDPLREKCTPSVDAYWDGAFVRPRSLNRIGEWWYVLYEGANHYPRQGTEPGTATQANPSQHTAIATATLCTPRSSGLAVL